MSKRYLSSLAFLVFALLGLVFPLPIRGWTGGTHHYLCPDEYPLDCGIADSLEFKKTYPFAEDFSHLCFDNKEDCLPRLVAKYYLKKYYLEGEKDLNLLGGAAHLLQDAACPDHWYPMRQYGGKIFVPFAPSWVGKTEGLVGRYLESGPGDWNLPREFQRRTINVNQAYLDTQREVVRRVLSQEPEETLEELEAQIKSKKAWSWLRSLKEALMLGGVILLPILGWELWKWKKERTGRFDLVATFAILGILLIVLLLIYLFY